MEGFDGWNGHQWGRQHFVRTDWTTGPDGLNKKKISEQ